MVIGKVLFKKSLSIGITGNLVPIVLAPVALKLGAQHTQAQPSVCRLPTPLHMPLAAGDLRLPALCPEVSH